MSRMRQFLSHSVGSREKLKASLGAGFAIFLTGFISQHFIEGAGLPILLASMGASGAILFAVPHSPMARPWPLIGGHLISALIGIGVVNLVEDVWTAAGCAVGFSILFMLALRCLHPPGSATTLTVVLGGASLKALGFQFLWTPLALNLILILLISQIVNRTLHRTSEAIEPKQNPPPLERTGINTDDLHDALKDVGIFLDISEEDLNTLYNLAAKRAYRREFGELTCERIMSKNLLTVEFGTGLEETWRLMQTQSVKALPVIDRGNHVIGIVTQTDFFKHAQIDQFQGLAGKIRKLIQKTPGTHSNKPEVAGQIMVSPVITARRNAHIVDLTQLLTERGIHQVPIVDDRNKLLGLVTQSDLIAALYRNVSELHP